MVPRVRVLPAGPVDDRAGGVLVGDALDPAQEAGAPHLGLDGGGAGDGGVRRRHHSWATTSEPIFTMNAETTTMKNTRTNRLPFATAVRAPT